VIFADVAGQTLERAQKLAPQLGTPIGLASYKPLNSTSEEDFLPNYLGMTGLPVDLRPEFPTGAPVVLLTASAAADAQIVAKMEAQLRRGGDVVITTGLLRALEGKGIEQIAEIGLTSHKLAASTYRIARWNHEEIAGPSPLLFPEIHYLTNDSWADIHGFANGRVFPILLRSGYGKGKLYTLAIPDNFTDLYRLPQPVLTAIKQRIAGSLPMQLDAPAQVALIPYDNGAAVVANYRDEPAAVRLILPATAKELVDLESGRKFAAAIEGAGPEARAVFTLIVEPHSYVALGKEK
jgi:hypothetical protein